MKHEGWEPAAAALGVALPPGAQDRLERYERLLVERAAPMGMVSPADVPRLRGRHLLDSLRAAVLIGTARHAYDLGSGAGFPGLVLAIARPELEITLVEVRRARAAFLRGAVQDLGLEHVAVYARRAETLRARVDLCLARAFAPARATWVVAEPLLEAGGRLIYWAGERFDPDVDLPDRVAVELFRTPALARSGALAIMSPQ